MPAKAMVNGKVVAETDTYKMVEENVYFPPSSIRKEMFTESNTHTTCPWKGVASYYNITTDKTEIKDAAWYYPETKEKANNIKGYVAFFENKVEVTKE